MGFLGLSKKLEGNPQHAETLAVLLVEVLVVNLVRLSNGGEIGMLSVPKPIEAAVDKDVVNQEITQAVGGDSGSNPESKVLVNAAGDETPGARDGENQKEGVVLFKESGLLLMMVSMEVPHGAVHEVFVGAPCHTFHGAECSENNKGCGYDFHGKTSRPIKNAACTISNKPAARLVLRWVVLRQAQARAKAMTHQAM